MTARDIGGNHPVFEDEFIATRFQLPESLKEEVGVPHDVAVVRHVTIAKIERKHVDVLPLVDHIHELLDDWTVITPEHPSSGRWVVFSRHEGRWVTTTVGPIRRGPGKGMTELVTFFVASDQNWILRKWAQPNTRWRRQADQHIWLELLGK